MLRVKVVYTHAVVSVHMLSKASAFWERQPDCVHVSSAVDCGCEESPVVLCMCQACGLCADTVNGSLWKVLLLLLVCHRSFPAAGNTMVGNPVPQDSR